MLWMLHTNTFALCRLSEMQKLCRNRLIHRCNPVCRCQERKKLAPDTLSFPDKSVERHQTVAIACAAAKQIAPANEVHRLQSAHRPRLLALQQNGRELGFRLARAARTSDPKHTACLAVSARGVPANQ